MNQNYLCKSSKFNYKYSFNIHDLNVSPLNIISGMSILDRANCTN